MGREWDLFTFSPKNQFSPPWGWYYPHWECVCVCVFLPFPQSFPKNLQTVSNPEPTTQLLTPGKETLIQNTPFKERLHFLHRAQPSGQAWTDPSLMKSCGLSHTLFSLWLPPPGPWKDAEHSSSETWGGHWKDSHNFPSACCQVSWGLSCWGKICRSSYIHTKSIYICRYKIKAHTYCNPEASNAVLVFCQGARKYGNEGTSWKDRGKRREREERPED